MQEFHSLGEPDLTLGGLRLWVHGREFPGSTDYYDANWLVITACCQAHGACVWVEQEPAVMTEELHRWRCELEQLLLGTRKHASLDLIEPYLYIEVRLVNPRGVWEVEVSLTPDNVKQEHRFYFEAHEGDLRMVVQQLRTILKRYPILGKRPE